ncbi:MAG TPA: hypothetical protein VFZ53_35200 [Polyangiaceae bacterium]
MTRAALAASLVFAHTTASAPARAEGDLQSPEQVSTRHSAYTLPAGVWSLEAGALGVGSGDVVALIGGTYGLGAGVQVGVNLAHFTVGLFNASVGYHFVDTRYFDLGARLGAWYGHGDWYWIATPAAKKIVSKIDVLSVPVELTASGTLTRWLEADLGVVYAYATFFGTSPPEQSVFTDNQLGLQQFFLRPGVRFFLVDHTALELFAKLPLYSAIPVDGKNPTLPFERTYTLEGGLRSRLTRGLFGSVRIHYGSISDVLYNARLYPSFEVELRL